MKISVVIPLYNKKETVLRALNSVLSQTVLPEEIIVVNDGSTDSSAQIVAHLDHSLIRLVNQSNQGVSAARNLGIAEAKHEWIAFLDADDEWMPEFLETVIGLIERYPMCSVAATLYLIQNSHGDRSPIQLRKIHFDGFSGLLSNYFQISSCSPPPLNSSAVAVKKEAIQEIGGFPVGITSGEDLITWAKLAVRFKIAYSIIPLSIFILDGKAQFRKPQSRDYVGLELKKMYQNDRIPHLKHYISMWHKMRAKSYLMLGYKRDAIIEIYLSIKMHLFSKALFFVPFILFNKKIFKMAVDKHSHS